jgi:putative alpha-1,2-mannosidase
LEQSISDYALGTLAIERGDIEDGEALLNRSHNWSNLWDPDIEFIHGRNRDGSFAELESQSAWTDDFAEGNARQYLWLVPHAPEELFDTLGGNKRSLERLTELFDEMEDEDGLTPGLPERWYWHGNEPTLHVPYFFALAGDKAEGDRWIDWIQRNRYSDQPDGLAGNDDGGTLSAWYVFSSLGFYPLAGTTRYVIGTPIWDRVEFSLNSSPITIEKTRGTPSFMLDGIVHEAPVFTHDQLANMVHYVE